MSELLPVIPAEDLKGFIHPEDLLEVLAKPGGLEKRLAQVNSPGAQMFLEAHEQLFNQGAFTQIVGARADQVERNIAAAADPSRIALKPKPTMLWAEGKVALPTTLEGLVLRGPHILQLDRLREITSLKSLYLENTSKVDDLSSLSHLADLQILACDGTRKIRDVAALEQLRALEYLDLSGTGASDLSPLVNLQALKALDLPQSKLKDVADIGRMQGLMHLRGWIEHVRDLSPLGQLRRLRSLTLCFPTRVADLSALAQLVGLEELNISDACEAASPKDFSFLISLHKLRRLTLNSTHFEDVSLLAELNQLEFLALGDTKATDFSPLYNHPTLRFVELPELPEEQYAEVSSAIFRRNYRWRP